MWKSLLLVVVACPLALLAFLIFWMAVNVKAGLIAGCSILGICLIVATLMLFYLKKFSLFDVFLPVVFAVVWSVLLIPFSFATSVFTAPAAIGSGIILTLCLWRVYHNNGLGKGWLILPIVTYLYEMLPVNIPGVFDDYFAFGGALTSAILFYLSDPSRHELAAGE